MTFVLLLIVFGSGFFVGYKLNALVAWWRRDIRRRTFRPVVLHPYEPESKREESRE